MNNSYNPTFSIPNNNFAMSDNSSNSNGSTSQSGGQSDGSSAGSQSLIPAYTIISTLSLTICFDIIYTVIILARPTFRNNKLNWFIVNVCITSVFLGTIMLESNIATVMSITSSFSCRAQSYLPIVGAFQMMYSHVTVAISRCLTIVHANKRIFRATLCVFVFIIFGWFVGFVSATPYLLFDGFACGNASQAAFLRYYALVAIVITPATIISICNLKIFWFVRQSSRRVHNAGGGNNATQARDIRLIKTMIVTFVVFISGWTPLFIEQTFNNTISVSKGVDVMFQVLPPFSMLFDVILLIYTNQPTRIFLWQLISHARQNVQNKALTRAVN